jgi:hypothetical protein
LQKPIIQNQDPDFMFFLEFVLSVKENYDFERRKWINLPLAKGFIEQESENPYIWDICNYIIMKLGANSG